MRSRKEDSHIFKPQENDHGGNGSLRFMMRIVRHYKSALSRKIGEVVQIRRSGELQWYLIASQSMIDVESHN